MSEQPLELPPGPDQEPQDRPPKRGGFHFPNPSGREWQQDKEQKDKSPKREKEPRLSSEERQNETPTQRRKRIERNLGRGYVGFAALVGKFDKYDQEVLMWQCEEFVDSTIEMAEANPRIYAWLDGASTVGVYGQFFGVITAITIPMLVNHGFLPEFFVDHLEGAPPLPIEGNDE